MVVAFKMENFPPKLASILSVFSINVAQMGHHESSRKLDVKVIWVVKARPVLPLCH